MSSTVEKETMSVDSLLTSMEQKRASARTMLNKCLFVRTSDLLKQVTSAAKTSDGKFFWITLEKHYHISLVKTALAIANQSGLTFPSGLLKEELFSHLLLVLNGQPQDDFFDKKKIETKGNRANQERKRLARKRSRAAARERRRECDKLKIPHDKTGQPVAGQTRSCGKCHQKFASRKKLGKHVCTSVAALPAKTSIPKETNVPNEAKRARQAKARLARRTKAKESKVAAKAARAEVVADKKLLAPSPVTGELGIVGFKQVQDGPWFKVPSGGVEYDACAKKAIGFKRGRFPKCGVHRTIFDFVAFEALPGPVADGAKSWRPSLF
ncbi:hypothetical protein K440DRAFT_679728 [Wilcoxina mikolae CBS 423.85]|nr:hypothetical protein K440DRAFT_679728 [Wilcoxina mikolae CBS 423.85]